MASPADVQVQQVVGLGRSLPQQVALVALLANPCADALSHQRYTARIKAVIVVFFNTCPLREYTLSIPL